MSNELPVLVLNVIIDFFDGGLDEFVIIWFSHCLVEVHSVLVSCCHECNWIQHLVLE